jgi:hypothetical protein
MKNLHLISFVSFFSLCISSYSQEKENPNPSPKLILDKIKQNVGASWVLGRHNSGTLAGQATFLFYEFEPNEPIIGIEYTVQDAYGRLYKTKESGMLRNYKYLSNNPKAYGTKIFSADWGTNEEPKYGKFYAYLELDEEIYKYKLHFHISGYTNWNHWTNILLNENEYQELVNLLTIKGTPKNIRKEREPAIAEKHKYDSLKNIEHRNNLIKSPIIKGNLKIATEPFPSTMNWWDALKACRNLGSGWRLPNENEFKLIEESINLSSSSQFWTSIDGNIHPDLKDKLNYLPQSQKDTNGRYTTPPTTEALSIQRGINNIYWENKIKKLHVIAVRELTSQELKDIKDAEAAKIAKIEEEKIRLQNLYTNYYDELRNKINLDPYETNNLLISRVEFEDINWEEANFLINEIGFGWRMPDQSLDDHNEINKFLEKNFKWYKKDRDLSWRVRVDKNWDTLFEQIKLILMPGKQPTTHINYDDKDEHFESRVYIEGAHWSKNQTCCLLDFMYYDGSGNGPSTKEYKCNSYEAKTRRWLILVKTKK